MDFDLQSLSASSSPSSNGSSSTAANSSTNFSDHQDNNDNNTQQLMLASTNPKKRAGRKIFKETRHPIYRGVRLRNSGKWPKWVCEVREPTNQKRIWFGTHPTVEMAARAHDVAAIAFRGKSACLNFADSAWRLPVPASSDIKDVQKAAAEAAQIFRPAKVKALAPPNQIQETTCNNTTGDDDDDRHVVVVMQEEEHQEANSSSNSINSECYYMDEEDVFSMPALLSDMFAGMMLPQPIYSSPFSSATSEFVDDSQAHLDFDLPLWSYY